MDLEGSHPKKLIKHVNNFNPSFTSVGMLTVMKPEISVNQIPEKAHLLYNPKNEKNVNNQTVAMKQQTRENPSTAKQSHQLSQYLNFMNTEAVKEKQSAGYNIINNI